MPIIVLNGAAWYKSVGTEQSPGVKLFSHQRPREEAGRVRAAAGHAAAHADLRLRWRARWTTSPIKAIIPGGSSTPMLPGERRGYADVGLRGHRQSRLDAGLRRGHRHRRGDLHRQDGGAPGRVLSSRVVRQVRSLPGRHGLDLQDPAIASSTAVGEKKISTCFWTFATTWSARHSARWAMRRWARRGPSVGLFRDEFLEHIHEKRCPMSKTSEAAETSGVSRI